MTSVVDSAGLAGFDPRRRQRVTGFERHRGALPASPLRSICVLSRGVLRDDAAPAAVRVLRLYPRSALRHLIQVVPRALVVGFVADRVVPRVQIGIGHGLSNLVTADDGEDIGDRLSAYRARAAICVREHGILDVNTVVREVTVVATEAGARPSALSRNRHSAREVHAEHSICIRRCKPSGKE